MLELEAILWRRAVSELGERTLEEFVAMFEVADCWRHGDEPLPCLERSIFLWHTVLSDATLATRAEPVLAQRCPVEEEMFRAQQNALVLIAMNRGGIHLRDVFFDRPDIRFRDDWAPRFTAHARPSDRFLVRLIVFRGVPLLDDLGVGKIVLAEGAMPQIRELLQETGITPSNPDWAWHIAAMWTAAATPPEERTEKALRH